MKLSELLKLNNNSRFPSPDIMPVGRDGQIPLSFAQERLWFLARVTPGNPFYNSPLPLHLTGEMHVPSLERALSEIMSRHEVLRTTIKTVEGAPVPIIASCPTMTLPLVDLQQLSEAELQTEVRRFINAEAERPFDLAQGPLLQHDAAEAWSA